MSVPWQMGVAIFFGSTLGKHLDVKYQTEAPVFNVFFTLLAIASSLYLVLRTLNKLNKDD